jgi:hypothetical protein
MLGVLDEDDQASHLIDRMAEVHEVREDMAVERIDADWCHSYTEHEVVNHVLAPPPNPRNVYLPLERRGVRIWFESEEGCGSTFSVERPTAQENSPDAPATSNGHAVTESVQHEAQDQATTAAEGGA